jgi:hypothetical protein
MKAPSPEQQLANFIAEYSPEIGDLARAVRERLRARLPGATELVYDNYNGLVIGYGPTERASDAILSIVVYPRWISLCFLQGAKLADPHHLLRGSGKAARHIVVNDATELDAPPVQDLITRALASASSPLDPASQARLVIKSVSAKQRPRRPV